TDSTGSREYNQKLSERRAQSVVKYLTDKEIDRERLTAAGYGEDRRRVVPDTSESAKAKNRRIEFVVTWGD
ncbi:MAG: OmpA family protein, partial [Hyphomicrobiaceae bacterium]